MAIRWRDGHEFYGGYGDTPKTPRPTFDGAVLSTGHARTVQVMSDIWGTETYAKVWNGSRIEDVPTAHSDDMGYRVYGDATIDASADALSAARAFLIAKEADRLKADWDKRANYAIAEAERVTRGKEVVVARGRKVPKGTKGDVFWLGISKGRFPTERVGVKDAAGTVHWTALSNVDVIDPLDYLEAIPEVPSAADLTARATALVDAESLRKAA